MMAVRISWLLVEVVGGVLRVRDRLLLGILGRPFWI